MRRTEALQGVRMISFRSVLDRHEAGELNQIEAGEVLGISERTFRRWLDLPWFPRVPVARRHIALLVSLVAPQGSEHTTWPVGAPPQCIVTCCQLNLFSDGGHARAKRLKPVNRPNRWCAAEFVVVLTRLDETK
jgi:hypothetical protein